MESCWAENIGGILGGWNRPDFLKFHGAQPGIVPRNCREYGRPGVRENGVAVTKQIRVVKGALDNILKFYFWLNFIYHVKMQLLIYEYKKKNSKIPSEN